MATPLVVFRRLDLRGAVASLSLLHFWEAPIRSSAFRFAPAPTLVLADVELAGGRLVWEYSGVLCCISCGGIFHSKWSGSPSSYTAR
jgi:hypothetical protein